jgi:hypothetical protein
VSDKQRRSVQSFLNDFDRSLLEPSKMSRIVRATVGRWALDDVAPMRQPELALVFVRRIRVSDVVEIAQQLVKHGIRQCDAPGLLRVQAAAMFFDGSG